MLTHLTTKHGTPQCGSKKSDPDLTNDPDEVTCKRCLSAAAATQQPASTGDTGEEPASSNGSRRGRSDFLTYEEILRFSSK